MWCLRDAQGERDGCADEVECAPLVWGGSVEIVGSLLALADGLGDPGSGRMISGVPSAISQVMSTSEIRVRAGAVVLAGEPLTSRILSAIRGTWPGARIRNIYGPTETTVYVTSWRCGEADQVPVIGRPITGTWSASSPELHDVT